MAKLRNQKLVAQSPASLKIFFSFFSVSFRLCFVLPSRNQHLFVLRLELKPELAITRDWSIYLFKRYQPLSKPGEFTGRERGLKLFWSGCVGWGGYSMTSSRSHWQILLTWSYILLWQITLKSNFFFKSKWPRKVNAHSVIGLSMLLPAIKQAFIWHCIQHYSIKMQHCVLWLTVSSIFF